MQIEIFKFWNRNKIFFCFREKVKTKNEQHTFINCNYSRNKYSDRCFVLYYFLTSRFTKIVIF